MATTAAAGEEGGSGGRGIPKGAYYALGILTLANLLNYLDRHIISILGESIRSDLQLDDAQLGFLLGTAFAIFYSVVGIAMGGISDRLPRKKVMAFGLVLWSVMTAMGGAATSFVTLAFARMGVGIGEAAAVPCAQSLLADIFPPRHRALAMGTYVTGTYFGGALAMVVGGYFLQNWDAMCAGVPLAGACSLSGWKAALIAVGLPGIPVALLLLLLREPPRTAQSQEGSAAVVLREFAAALPPFTLGTIAQLGGGGLARNLVAALGIGGVAAALAVSTGDVAQWASLGFGVFAVASWAQIQAYRDRPLFRLTFGDPTFMYATGATAITSCVLGSISAWAAPFAMRNYAVAPGEIGLALGVINTVGSVSGIVAGSWLTDRWKQRDLRAPVFMGGVTLLAAIPCSIFMLTALDVKMYLLGYGLLSVAASLFGGANAALIQDLVLPRMRGSAAACYSLIVIVITFGMGPYWAGKVSALTGSLTTGMLSLLALVPVALTFLWRAARRLPSETAAGRRARAEAVGELPAQVLRR